MKRAEQHVIERMHPLFRAIDQMALASKNLWNLANYHVRQSFIFQHIYLDNTALFHRIKHTDARPRPSRRSRQSGARASASRLAGVF
jgi:putative transposase